MTPSKEAIAERVRRAILTLLENKHVVVKYIGPEVPPPISWTTDLEEDVDRLIQSAIEDDRLEVFRKGEPQRSEPESSLATRKADARGILRNAGFLESEILEIIPDESTAQHRHAMGEQPQEFNQQSSNKI